ncbi:MAG: hypothetical protein H6573_32150 [Lewinellaceae bacterium]|nr:hypothetical protein [Lewinellaceae bacterium]
MKSLVSSMLLTCLTLLAIPGPGISQPGAFARRAVLFDFLGGSIGTDVSQPFLGLQVQPARGFASHFSLVATARGHARNYSDEAFGVEEMNWAVMSEVRVHPFGMRQVGFRKKMPWQKRQVKTGCFPKKKCMDGKCFSKLLRGVYIAPGYQYEKTNFTYLPPPGLETPITDFSFALVNQGPSFRLGYQLRLPLLTAGMSYGWMAGQPKGEGPFDVFGDEAYTNTFPFKYRLESNLRLEVGIHF